jgi:hypothetical protein
LRFLARVLCGRNTGPRDGCGGVSGGPASPRGRHPPSARGGPERPVRWPVLGSMRVGVTGAVLGRARGRIVGRWLPEAAHAVGGLVAAVAGRVSCGSPAGYGLGGRVTAGPRRRPRGRALGRDELAQPSGLRRHHVVTASCPRLSPRSGSDPRLRFPPLKGGTSVCAPLDAPAPQKTKPIHLREAATHQPGG